LNKMAANPLKRQMKALAPSPNEMSRVSVTPCEVMQTWVVVWTQWNVFPY